MVPGSRRILSLLSKVKVYPGGQMQAAKQRCHHQAGWNCALVAEPQKDCTTGNAKDPAQHLKSAGYEKTGGVERAPVKHQPQDHEIILSFPAIRISEEKTDEQGQSKWKKQGLGNATGRRRPERFSVLQCLAPHEEESAN